MPSTIWKRLGDTHPGSAKILDRTKGERSDGGAGTKPYKFFFREDVDLTVEQIIDIYKKTERAQRKIEQDAKKPTQEEIIEEHRKRAKEIVAKKERAEDGAERVVFPDPAPGLKEDIERAIRQNFGINVRVSGRIEIVFKLGDA